MHKKNKCIPYIKSSVNPLRLLILILTTSLSIPKEKFFKIFKEAKYISFSISLRKEAKMMRTIKNLIYYNKPLYDIAGFFITRMPQNAKRLLKV